MTSETLSRNIKEPPDFHQHSSQAPTLIMRHLQGFNEENSGMHTDTRHEDMGHIDPENPAIAQVYSRRKTKTNGPLCQAQLLEE